MGSIKSFAWKVACSLFSFLVLLSVSCATRPPDSSVLTSIVSTNDLLQLSWGPEVFDPNKFRPATAVVRRVETSFVEGAEYAYRTNDWHPLKTELILDPRTQLRTKENTEVDLEFYRLGDRTPLVRMMENSSATLESLLQFTNEGVSNAVMIIRLHQGKLAITLRALHPASIFEVRIPQGTARGRDGQFSIGADGVITVLTGIVWFKSGDTIHAIKEGETFSAQELSEPSHAAL